MGIERGNVNKTSKNSKDDDADHSESKESLKRNNYNDTQQELLKNSKVVKAVNNGKHSKKSPSNDQETRIIFSSLSVHIPTSPHSSSSSISLPSFSHSSFSLKTPSEYSPSSSSSSNGVLHVKKILDLEKGSPHHHQDKSLTFPVLDFVQEPDSNPLEFPVHQVMDRSEGGYDPSRIPSSVFEKKPGSPVEWSVASNDSLFSLKLGRNNSSMISRERVKSMGSLNKFGDVDFAFTPPPPISMSDKDHNGPPIDGSGQFSLDIERIDGEAYEIAEKPPAATNVRSNSKDQHKTSPEVNKADGNEDSSSSFAFPIKKKKCEWPWSWSWCYCSNCSRAYLCYCAQPNCCSNFSCYCSNCSWALCYCWNCSQTRLFWCGYCHPTTILAAGEKVAHPKTIAVKQHVEQILNDQQKSKSPQAPKPCTKSSSSSWFHCFSFKLCSRFSCPRPSSFCSCNNCSSCCPSSCHACSSCSSCCPSNCHACSSCSSCCPSSCLSCSSCSSCYPKSCFSSCRQSRCPSCPICSCSSCQLCSISCCKCNPCSSCHPWSCLHCGRCCSFRHCHCC